MQNDDRQSPPSRPALFDPDKDGFARYRVTPHLGDAGDKSKIAPRRSPLLEALSAELKGSTDKEDFYNRLRRFKRCKIESIARLEEDPLANRRAILRQLSDLAVAIIAAAYDHVAQGMPSDLGMPCYLASYKQVSASVMAVIGMGKLASHEMNYESDVDLAFIYSHIGETNGVKSVANDEYFIRFAQRLINTLMLLTETGRCYQIDVELRPSGNAGPLVTSFDHFLDHQMNQSEPWERMALLRARAVVLPDNFGLPLTAHLDDLRWKRPLPDNFFPDMHAIRERVAAERAQESKHRIDLKFGLGGLMDIEFILHGLALKCQAVYPQLRQSGMFELIDAVAGLELLSAAEIAMLTEAHLLYRTLESKLHLAKRRAEHVMDTGAKDFSTLIHGLGHGDAKVFTAWLLDLRHGVREIYRRYYHAA